MKNEIILHVTKEDIEGAESFCLDCILELAAKRQLKADRAYEGVDVITIDGKDYKHEQFTHSDYMSAKANPQPFDIVLTPVS